MNDVADKLLDSNRMYAKLLETGNDWADKKAAYGLLDSMTKSVLADLTKKQGYANSRVEAETNALATTDYKQHLQKVADAHCEFLLAQVKYESLKTLVELRRSEESSRRAELSALR